MKHQIIKALLGLFLLGSTPVWAASVKTLNLDQLVEFSDRVFKGKVVDVSRAFDGDESGYFVVYTTFEIDECLKGACSQKEVTIKQVDNPRQGLPTYEVGKTYFIFLAGDSDKTGLVAPIGLWQGRLEMVQQNGKWVIPSLTKSTVKKLSNGGKNLSTVKSLAATTDNGNYESFKAAVQGLINEGDR